MTDEDFQQTVRDYFGIEAQRHRDIMATLAEILSQITEINTSIDAKATASAEAHASLRAAVEKTLADLAATGAAGHASVLDKIGAVLKDTQAKIDSDRLPDTVRSTEAEITKAIGAVPVPSVPSPAAQ
jgi:Tfp pilus assembly major pilin PilA